MQIDEENVNEEWDAFVNTVKSMVDPLDLDFAHGKDEESGVTIWALVRCIIFYEVFKGPLNFL